MTTKSARDQARDLLGNLPENCTWEQIADRILLEAKMHRAHADLAAGRIQSQSEVERESGEWLKSIGPPAR